jgi:hypothetical protein
MSAKNNIIDELRVRLALAALKSQRGVILQPGAIGDCILTLPLANLMKETVCRGGIDIVGHTEYIGILPGRSCVDGVRSLDSMALHRLFAKEAEFELTDGDPLIMAFADYAWIVTFLGETNSSFEWNLIFTANCSHSAEVMTLALKPLTENESHISDFYRKQFIEQSGFDPSTTLGTGKLAASGLSPEEHTAPAGASMIKPTQEDVDRGREILAEHGVMPIINPVVIHPGSGGKHKCWHLDNFLSIARKLEGEGMEVVFLLGPAEVERFGESQMGKIGDVGRLIANLSLADALAVLSCAGGYIGNDSGITHLAAALGVRTVAVFGPTDPAVYGPIGSEVTILRSREPDFAGAISEDLQQQVCEILLA